jgi:hypothetical protein
MEKCLFLHQAVESISQFLNYLNDATLTARISSHKYHSKTGFAKRTYNEMNSVTYIIIQQLLTVQHKPPQRAVGTSSQQKSLELAFRSARGSNNNVHSREATFYPAVKGSQPQREVCSPRELRCHTMRGPSIAVRSGPKRGHVKRVRFLLYPT